MEQLKAVIFDLDNTLLDRTHTFSRFTQAFVNQYFGHVENAQPLHERIIRLDEDGYKDKRKLFTELLEEMPWDESVEKPAHEALMDYYEEHYVSNAVLMHEANEVIAHARTKYKVGLITNGRTLIQYGKIDQLGIREAFDLIIVSEEAGVKKPNPQIFELATSKLGLRAEECLYIGDHPVNDIEGASKAGMATIWIKVNQPWRDELEAKPLHTIEQLNELLRLI
ncbi:HAD family hydrolase [Paenibacillus sp. OV219]|uniref:HAD family hydrolase n=1 Tax=Paenibacillus sp. OV219 TaxID=1884377 RepID=UPI0008C4E35B|nr:HAD family hydrolase [Paenibacillus sp. OV219]SEO94049.1 putative hydrolase of the HAD superfamily [Paenibacillus sp. OV219]